LFDAAPQPRTSSAGSGGGGGKSADDTVYELASDILAALPPPLSPADGRPGLFDAFQPPAAGARDGPLARSVPDSLLVVLGQEMDKFNRLLGVMAAGLSELQRAIRGIALMSGEVTDQPADRPADRLSDRTAERTHPCHLFFCLVVLKYARLAFGVAAG
jgi:hypothetical protein